MAQEDNTMKRSDVTVEALKRMGYKAMVSQTSWNSHTESECNARQSEELFDLVARTARDGGHVEIQRNIVGGTVVAYVGGTSTVAQRMGFHYFLQRPMSEAEVMEYSIQNGVWISR